MALSRTVNPAAGPGPVTFLKFPIIVTRSYHALKRWKPYREQHAQEAIADTYVL